MFATILSFVSVAYVQTPYLSEDPRGFFKPEKSKWFDVNTRANLDEGDDVVVVSATTEDEYVNALNTEYSSGVIKQLDVYAHGGKNSINLGGPQTGAPNETSPADKD